MNNQLCRLDKDFEIIQILTSLLYPLITSINRCDGSCNTVEDPFGRICVPNKTEHVI